MKNFVTTEDFKGTNIEKSYSTDEIFKAHKGSRHTNHKYLSVDDEGYHYEHSKMTSKDHFDAADLHINERRKAEPASEAHVQHGKLAEEHEALGWEKEVKERKKIKKDTDSKLGEKVAKKSSSFDDDVKQFIEDFGKKHPGDMPHKALAKEFGMNESMTKHYVKKYLRSPSKENEVEKSDFIKDRNSEGKSNLNITKDGIASAEAATNKTNEAINAASKNAHIKKQKHSMH
jgi:hypothetical protein